MAFSSTSPAVRLRSLEKAKERCKVLKRGETLAAMPMAKLLAVSWNTLKRWCDEVDGFEESGAFERGANGKEYKFQARKSLDYLIKHFTAEADRASKRAKRTTKLIGGGALDDMPDDYSLDELNKALSTSIKLFEHRERVGEFTNKAQQQAALNRTFSAMQMAALRVPNELDPTGQWPKDRRQFADMLIRQVLVSQEREARKELREPNGGAA